MKNRVVFLLCSIFVAGMVMLISGCGVKHKDETNMLDVSSTHNNSSLSTFEQTSIDEDKPIFTPVQTLATGTVNETNIIEQTSVAVSGKIQMTFKNLNTDDGVLNIMIQNSTTETYEYGYDFTLEKYENDVWNIVSQKESTEYEAVGVLILPEEMHEIRVSLAEYYERLTMGTYRLTKSFYDYGSEYITFELNIDMDFLESISH